MYSACSLKDNPAPLRLHTSRFETTGLQCELPGCADNSDFLHVSFVNKNCVMGIVGGQ